MANPAKARSLSEFATKFLGATKKAPKYSDVRKKKLK